MKWFFNGRNRRLTSAAAVGLSAVVALLAFAQDASAGACEDAFLRCMEDASALLSKGNILPGLAYAAFCVEGYAFCREFLQE